MSSRSTSMALIVAIPVEPLLYFSCSIVRKLGSVQVLRSADREKPFLGWATRSAPCTTSFPIHLRVLYYPCMVAQDLVATSRVSLLLLVSNLL